MVVAPPGVLSKLTEGTPEAQLAGGVSLLLYRERRGIMPKFKPVDYPPGRPGVAIQHLKSSHPHLRTKPVSKQRKPLQYNDQLPLPGFD